MFGSRERLYNSWVRDHYRFLFRSAWALTGSRTIAEEVVQDCFELAWRNMDQLRDRRLARAWLFQILRHEALRSLAEPNVPYDEEQDHRPGADAVTALEQRLDILRSMQKLSTMHREVLTLFYFEDMAVSEMAIALEVAPGTVLSRLNRARRALQQAMADSGAGARAASRGSAETAEIVELPRTGANAAARDK
ncbi:MAG: RNA polymerase sigma factor [Burkholderiales bacterium]|nr:RNA polymerase sigma factor [Burkholderiales bacterium]MBY0509683.1 RNA polymerase sigma factor [Rhodospirillaceae bacterium]